MSNQVNPEALARIAQGVEAATGHGGLVEAHPVAVVTPEGVTAGSVQAVNAAPAPAADQAPAPSEAPAPAPAPAPTTINVNVPSK